MKCCLKTFKEIKQINLNEYLIYFVVVTCIVSMRIAIYYLEQI